MTRERIKPRRRHKTSFHICRCPADTRLKEGNDEPETKTGGMLPLPRVGGALLGHCLNSIQPRRACQSIPSTHFPVEPQIGL
jgi:hypothetical protein